MKHFTLKFYKAYLNDDFGLNFTNFTAFEREKIRKCVFVGLFLLCFCDMKMQFNSIPSYDRGQGHLSTLARRVNSLKHFVPETTRLLAVLFQLKPL